MLKLRTLKKKNVNNYGQKLAIFEAIVIFVIEAQNWPALKKSSKLVHFSIYI